MKRRYLKRKKDLRNFSFFLNLLMFSFERERSVEREPNLSCSRHVERREVEGGGVRRNI